MKEFEIIDLIKKEQKISKSNIENDILIGIGDDTALLSNNYGNLLITQDAMSEGVHFNLNYSTGENIANKLFNSNISDIASMGGIPKFALITAGLTKKFNKTHLKKFITTINKQSKKYGISIIGGDTVSSKSEASYFSMTLLGTPINKNITLKRYTGNIGDYVCTTGFTGISAYGLELLTNGSRDYKNQAILNHINGINRFDIISKLIKFNITAMTDISDGLVSNANMLAKKRFGISLSNIPKSPIIKSNNSEKLILSGGEDYELVFSISPTNYKKLIEKIPEIFKIGKIISENKIFVNNREINISNIGYEHSF